MRRLTVLSAVTGILLLGISAPQASASEAGALGAYGCPGNLIDTYAVKTADGGALVFFTTRYYEKRTAYAGTSVPSPGKAVEALTEGEIKQSLTMEFVSNEVALDPKGSGKVDVLGRIQGLTSAKGE